MNQSPSLFLSFLKHPGQVGALCPSSKSLCRQITSGIGIERASVVVELGAGTGVITSAIARRVSPSAKVLSVELNCAMCDALNGKFSNVEIVNDSATHIPDILAARELSATDAVISGLPWASFPEELQQEILNSICLTLSPDGCFTTFAYLQGLLLPAAKRFRKLLDGHFRRIETSRVVWKNLPPAVIYRCWEHN